MIIRDSKRKHISPSGLSMFQRCPMQYFHRYVEGIVKPPGVVMVEGTATHRAVEVDLTNKRDEGELLPLDAVQDAARDALNNKWSEGVELSTDERTVGEKKIRGAAIDRAVSLATLHHEDVAPEINPQRIEHRFELDLPGESGWSVVGFIDCQEAPTPTSKSGIIRDTKTKLKSPPKGFADTSDQLTTYAWAAREMDGAIPSALKIDALVSLKKPKHVQQVTQRSEADIATLHERLNRTVDAIKKGVFLPCPRDAWTCSERWCGYFGECPFGARSRMQVAMSA